MSHSTKGKKVVYISAVNGQYVTEDFAKKNRRITVKLHVPINRKKGK